jgi:hypothetical protein
MIHDLPSNLSQAVISAVSFEGLTITTGDGRPARLAIIDDQGTVIEAGDDVAAAVWNVSIDCYRRFLIGEGHLRVYSEPPNAGAGKAAA